MSLQPIQDLQEVENLKGIESSKANDIADHYRKLGGYKITISEDMFRSDIQVCRLPESAIQGNYRRVNR